MTIGTISLDKTTKQVIIKPVETPKKKHNIIEVKVYVDGMEHSYVYDAPLSQSLMNSQKGRVGIGQALIRGLSTQFGKVEEK